MKPWPGVHHALRMALYEFYVEGAAPHGAVHAAVGLVRGMERGASQSGLANGVLRNVLRQGQGAWDALPLPRLPKWLRKPLLGDFGKARIASLEEVFAAPAPLDLTPRDGDAAALAAQVGGRVLATGSVRLSDPGQVTGLPGYEDGTWWVQDAAAAMPVRVLDPQPGERILDMCAAPGGKTLQLAAAGAEVTALDLSETRIKRVTENLRRCGLAADVVVGDALTHDGGPYDAVLLDAPCSATGTLRRHPDLPYAKDGGDFPELFALQAQMIDAALRLVRPGGRVVFCTCSLLIDEGEEQISDALIRHPDLTLEPEALARPGIDPAWIGPEGGLRLMPDHMADQGGIDGFYMARLRRPG